MDVTHSETDTLSLHDALPIYHAGIRGGPQLELQRLADRPHAVDVRVDVGDAEPAIGARRHRRLDRKSTRLNSSHSQISYAVFCLKKKKTQLKIICRELIVPYT